MAILARILKDHEELTIQLDQSVMPKSASLKAVHFFVALVIVKAIVQALDAGHLQIQDQSMSAFVVLNLLFNIN